MYCAFCRHTFKGSYHQFKAALIYNSRPSLDSGVNFIVRSWRHTFFLLGIEEHFREWSLYQSSCFCFPWIVSDSSEASEELICKPKWSKTFRFFHLEISLWGRTGFVTTRVPEKRKISSEQWLPFLHESGSFDTPKMKSLIFCDFFW